MNHRNRLSHTKIILIFLLSCAWLMGCSTAVSEESSGTLDIDYINEDGDITEEEVTAETDSGGMLGWLKEKLRSDKTNAGDSGSPEESSAEGQEESGLRQIYGLGNEQKKDPAEDSENTVQEDNSNQEDAEAPAGQTQPRSDGQAETPGGGENNPNSVPGNTPAPDDSQTKPVPPEIKNTVTFTIRCDTAVDNGMHQESKWAGIVPADGCILPVTTMEFDEGDTVFDLLCDVRDTYKLHMSYRGSGGGEYIDGINNLYEFDGGRWSGWMYCVNGWYPNYGCGQYTVKNGDVIEWNYTCDLGLDLDAGMEGAQEWKDTHD